MTVVLLLRVLLFLQIVNHCPRTSGGFIGAHLKLSNILIIIMYCYVLIIIIYCYVQEITYLTSKTLTSLFTVFSMDFERVSLNLRPACNSLRDVSIACNFPSVKLTF